MSICSYFFDLLNDSLVFLSSGASCKRSARIFELKLLEHLGLVPEIKFCVRCRAQSPEPAHFSVTQGGILCKECHGAKGSGQSGTPVSKGTLNFLQHVQRSGIQDLYKVKVAQEVGEELEKILRRFVDFHLHNKLKSITFIEKMGLN